jgi:hypothetical protein
VVRRRPDATVSTYIGWEDNGRRGKVQLGYVEGLVQKVCRVQLVESNRPNSTLSLWRLRLSAEVHAGHLLVQARDTGRVSGSRIGAASVGSLIAIGLRVGGRGTGLRGIVLRYGTSIRRNRGLMLSVLPRILRAKGRDL